MIERSDLGLQLAVALSQFWVVRGYLSEGRSWLEGFLARAGRNRHPPHLACERGLYGVQACWPSSRATMR